MHAAEIAAGMRADVTIFDISAERLAAATPRLAARCRACFVAQGDQDFLPGADLVIGCVLVTGAAAPKLISARI